MISAAHAALMADYNGWMNGRLFDLCAGLGEDALAEDRGAFFGSIRRTLDHIMVIDLIFMFRFTGDPAEPPPFGEPLHETFAALHAARGPLDARIRTWAATLTADELATEASFTSMIDGKRRCLPVWAFVTQIFNHQTHHRGQVTTLLAQMGHDMGTTDIPFMPRFEVA